MFLGTRHLRSLSLTGVSVDLILFEALAELRHLTELRLQRHADTKAACSYRFHAKANLLGNLRSLRLDIRCPYRTSLLESLSGARLSRLQVLELPQCELNGDQMKRLFSELPSLLRFSSLRRLSPWMSEAVDLESHAIVCNDFCSCSVFCRSRKRMHVLDECFASYPRQLCRVDCK